MNQIDKNKKLAAELSLAKRALYQKIRSEEWFRGISYGNNNSIVVKVASDNDVEKPPNNINGFLVDVIV